MLKIRTIQEALSASIISGDNLLDGDVDQVYASDLMSDVLAFGKPNSVLFTGLATQQAIISAHMAEFKGVVLIRGKKPKDGSEKVARDNDLVLLSTDFDMFDACVIIDSYNKGAVPAQAPVPKFSTSENLLLSNQFVIEGNDFASAGMVSTEIKSILKKIGLDAGLIRRVAISTYEAEMNVVMHAKDAKVDLHVSPKVIEVVIADRGKGIPNIDRAMQQGYSTATEEMRAMGFGAGMGLPNIKKNSDQLDVESEVGVGTTLRISFNLNSTGVSS